MKQVGKFYGETILEGKIYEIPSVEKSNQLISYLETRGYEPRRGKLNVSIFKGNEWNGWVGEIINNQKIRTINCPELEALLKNLNLTELDQPKEAQRGSQ